MSVPVALNRLRAALASPDAPNPGTGLRESGANRQAAVLALLWSTQSQPTASELRLVAIEKSAHLRHHAGQVAFPGGRIEPGETPVQGALREAWEEVGVEADSVRVLGGLPTAVVPVSGFDVHTLVGWWNEPVTLQPVDVGEVAAVHQLVVSELAAPQNRASWRHPAGYSGPAFLVDDLFIWGLTGYLIAALLDLGGWTQPWDRSHCLDIPQRFFSGRP